MKVRETLVTMANLDKHEPVQTSSVLNRRNASHPSRLPHVRLIALLTSNGQSHHQGHKLFEVHLAVSVGVQVLHDFVHRSGVLLRLRRAQDALTAASQVT